MQTRKEIQTTENLTKKEKARLIWRINQNQIVNKNEKYNNVLILKPYKMGNFAKLK